MRSILIATAFTLLSAASWGQSDAVLAAAGKEAGADSARFCTEAKINRRRLNLVRLNRRAASDLSEGHHLFKSL